MAYKCFAAREVLLTTLGVGILSSILVPLGVRRTFCGSSARCPSNLRQLHQLGTASAASPHGRWPDATGSALWRSFGEMKLPLIGPESLEVLSCPLKGDGEPGRCDYLGPRRPASELGPGDALAGDRPGNHGEPGSGNVLFKDGSVREFEASHPIWRTLSE